MMRNNYMLSDDELKEASKWKGYASSKSMQLSLTKPSLKFPHTRYLGQRTNLNLVFKLNALYVIFKW